MKASWDIFCSVVDNYGDIGVTWRLARQLVAEHQVHVRLWVDDVQAFVPLCPEADASAAQQWQQGVEVRVWPKDWQPVEVADVVIEAFACTLPDSYRQAMKAREKPALWINLEYLSAEDWVSGCHGLPSLRPDGLKRMFFFPGFDAGTGGLLREADLLVRRRAFEQDAQARQTFLQGLGVFAADNARLISLFAYENSGLASWLDAMATGNTPTHLLVPQGRIMGDLLRWLDIDELALGQVEQRGSLTVQALPFVRQQDYDRLLWSCDFNAVRGEDSFVRAQWAGRPLLWHIYEQEEDAHWVKLNAFLALYVKGLSPAAAHAFTGLWHAWNAGSDMAQRWNDVQEHWQEISDHAEQWCLEQSLQADLAQALVLFYRNWI
ncbi:elongation factor P maturation arginine rhamnosyltransferase EarP [Pseudomonas sp. CCC3.1]|uniref:elongation factor P maturation arginine rhamnosyltransferase EarP n=1 Tax=Pseudomonas sp. CCC3.1 TaxID=3048607 RepID=UPI002AC94936|nr:elongation factor P maturation arginine rhamnosyltransferase EarP [Pseudomonas sp. CCC3.1]MEB0206973.1 elongation factor P maturation arginine rhamnosyltransferase EarP [Pseudomonas sp. CCC3.1]WPX37494.1 elongation factor P maturation arginine rhamnosyltransferase EarP [Pseudomonas sp. CCC3.1]